MAKRTLHLKPTSGAKSQQTNDNQPRFLSRIVSSFMKKRGIALPPYEAGNPGSRRGVFTTNAGPNTVLLGRLDSLRNESRQAVRTNGFASHISDVLVTNVVGTGIRPMTPFPELQQLWEDWTDEADSRGQYDFYGLQQAAFRGMVEGGETFNRLRSRYPDDVETVPLQIQTLEAEHVPAQKNIIAPNGNRIVGGIERDMIDRPAAYWMYRSHPNDFLTTGDASNLIEVRVPGADVVHLFNPRRPGQVRGEPWLSRALVKMRDLDDYDDAEVVRKKAATNIGGFYRKPVDGDDGAVPNSQPGASPDIIFQDFEPGTFIELPPGYDVTMSEPTDVGGQYEAFWRAQLGAIGVSVNLIYEQVSGDWRGMNDRSYRAAMLELTRVIESWQWHLMVFQYCRPIWRRFVTEAILSGAWTPPAGKSQRDIYRVKWSMPARGYVHPVQEVTAYVAALQAGFLSREQIAQQLGSSVFEVDMQNSLDRASADERGLIYSTYLDSITPKPETPAHNIVQAVIGKEVEDQVGKWAGDQED